jgi:hypothetical protein
MHERITGPAADGKHEHEGTRAVRADMKEAKLAIILVVVVAAPAQWWASGPPAPAATTIGGNDAVTKQQTSKRGGQTINVRGAVARDSAGSRATPARRRSR